MTEQEKALFALGLTEEEVAQVVADDKRIDKGEKLFELTEEQKKASKDARIVHTVDAYGRNRKKEKKSDEPKAEIVRVIANALIDAELVDASTLRFENVERELTFSSNGRKFKIVLSAPRT